MHRARGHHWQAHSAPGGARPDGIRRPRSTQAHACPPGQREGAPLDAARRGGRDPAGYGPNASSATTPGSRPGRRTTWCTSACAGGGWVVGQGEGSVNGHNGHTEGSSQQGVHAAAAKTRNWRGNARRGENKTKAAAHERRREQQARGADGSSGVKDSAQQVQRGEKQRQGGGALAPQRLAKGMREQRGGRGRGG